jgi:hypothetical protein
MDDRLNDASLEREIESLVASDPSPEFLARVRTRVAQEPAPGGWRLSWMVTIAGAVAAVIVAVIVWPSSEPVATPGAPAREPLVAEVPRSAPQPAPALPAVRDPNARPRVVNPAARTDLIELNLPDVLVAANEVKAFASFVASIRQGTFDVVVPAAPDLNEPLEIKELPELPPVVVEPIEVEPIVALAALQPEGERP